jgi:hypothetical protein
MTDRHPSVQHLVRMLTPNPHLPEPMYTISCRFANLRDEMLYLLPNDGPELSAGLRKLLEAKDCLVRQSGVDAEDSIIEGG